MLMPMSFLDVVPSWLKNGLHAPLSLYSLSVTPVVAELLPLDPQPARAASTLALATAASATLRMRRLMGVVLLFRGVQGVGGAGVCGDRRHRGQDADGPASGRSSRRR